MKIKIWQISIYFSPKLKILDPYRKNKLDYEDKGYYYKLKGYEPNIKQDQYNARTPPISLKPPAARFPLQFARLCSTLSCRFNVTPPKCNDMITDNCSGRLSKRRRYRHPDKDKAQWNHLIFQLVLTITKSSKLKHFKTKVQNSSTIPCTNSHSIPHKYLTLRSVPIFMLCWIHCEHLTTIKMAC